jgi:hypothetical protein
MFFLVYVWIILLLYLVPSFFGTFVLYEQGWKWILKLHPLVIKPWTKCDYLGTCVTLFGVLKGWQELVSLFSLCLKGDSCTMKSISTTCFLLFFARMKQLLLLPLNLLAIVASRIYIVFAFWSLYLSLWTLQLLNLNHVNTRGTIS